MKPIHLGDAVRVHSADKQTARRAKPIPTIHARGLYGAAQPGEKATAMGGCHHV